MAEVLARRLGSPLDSLLRLTDGAGLELASNDDFEDKGAGLASHHADSYLRATLPKDGAYYVQVTDRQRKGSPECGYRLRVGSPEPDYELRVVPSSVNVRGGAEAVITVYALRKDGFTNEIGLALKDAPEGFKLGGLSIPAGQDKAQLTISAPRRPIDEPISVVLEGSARCGSETLVRRAVPAEDMMQAFAYRHLVPVRELKICVIGGPAR